MAETFDKLQNILETIRNLERNFRKKGLHLRTGRYVDNEIKRLETQFSLYKNLNVKCKQIRI